MLSLIPTWLKLAAAGLAGACLLAAGSYAVGRHEGRQAAAVAALEASVKAINSRNKIDEDISSADVARLCSDFGLSVSDEAECLRRVSEAASQP